MVGKFAMLCLCWAAVAVPGWAQEPLRVAGDDSLRVAEGEPSCVADGSSSCVAERLVPRVADGDTLRYAYTPLPADSTARRGGTEVDRAAATPDGEAADTVKRRQRDPFFRRVVKYFEGSNVDRTFEKKIDFTLAGGPSYSEPTSLGFGLLAAGLYRIDRTDSVSPPSDVSLFVNLSISGFYAVGLSGNSIFSRNGRRLTYALTFSSSPRNLWGRGYHDGMYRKPSTYTEKLYQVEGTYLYPVLPHTYVGTVLSFENSRGTKFSDIAYINGEKSAYTNTGIGLILEYDSRDFIPNPFRGIYVSFQERVFPKWLGSCKKTIWRSVFTANAYRQLWKGGVLAADLYAVFNSEDTPWTMLARMGGNQRMRGYYLGQYADNCMITAQIELRQRIWRRIGCVVWGGAGNVFPAIDRFVWAQTLPNYGAGLRWEFKKRVNVRIDYGFGKKTQGFLLSINEAF